jgi:hypothetical protein
MPTQPKTTRQKKQVGKSAFQGVRASQKHKGKIGEGNLTKPKAPRIAKDRFSSTRQPIPPASPSRSLTGQNSKAEWCSAIRASLKQQPSQRKRQKRGKIDGKNNAKYGGKLNRKIPLQLQKQIGRKQSEKQDTVQIQSTHKNAKIRGKIKSKITLGESWQGRGQSPAIHRRDIIAEQVAQHP